MGIENTEKEAANMLLTKEQLKACATGWLETREDEEGLIFFRIPEALRPYMGGKDVIKPVTK